jgi:hypothetical protein
MKEVRFWICLVLAVMAGLFIGWVDSRPTWDDAGITAAAIFAVTFVLGAAMPNRAWVWAVAVGGCVIVFNFILYKNLGSALGMVFAFAGAYAGAFVRKAVFSKP